MRRLAVAIGGVVLALVVPLERPAAVFSPLVSVDQAAPAPQTDASQVRSRYVAVSTATFPQPRTGAAAADRQADISLELFPDVYVVASFDRFDVSPGRSSEVRWVGRIRGDARSSVTLVYDGAFLTASVITSTASYAIRPAPADVRAAMPQPVGQVHVVSQVNTDALPPELPPLVPEYGADALEAARDVVMTDTADRIDVLVLYTAAARDYAGGEAGIRQLILLGESETNSAYNNTGIFQRIRVVNIAPVTYQEEFDFGVMLPALRAGSAPGLEGVAALRDQYGADLVKLVVRPVPASACGIAYVMNNVSVAFAPSGYSVTSASCISPGLTFAHELGHNMGAHHDWYVATSTLPYTYAHGFAEVSGGQGWRTIMAYPDYCTARGVSCRRLVQFSNPDIRISNYCGPGARYTCNPRLWFIPSLAAGIPGGTRSNCRTGNVADTQCDADNRRALNNTALTVANLRQTVVAASPQ